MNSLYKSMNRRVPSLDAALSAVLGTALTSTRCPLATALRQVRGARWRGLSVAVLLMGLMGGLGVVDPAFGQVNDGRCDAVGCLDEKPVYNCKTSAPAVPTGVTVDNNHAGLRVHWDRPAAGTGIVEYIVYRRSGAGSQFAEFAKLTSDALPSYVYFDASFNGVNEYYRCAQSGGVTLPDPWASPSEKPQFLDTFVENGNNYIYRVKARTLREGTATGRSAWSSPSSRNYHQVAMDAPTGLSGSPNANGLPVLTWTAPSFIASGGINSQRARPHAYQLRRCDTSLACDQVANWTELARPGNVNDANANATTLTDSSSSLAGSTTYIYQVRGVRKHFPTVAHEANITPVWQDGPWSTSSANITTPATITRQAPPPVTGNSNPLTPQAATIPAQALPVGSAVISASATQLEPGEAVTLTATTANAPDGFSPSYYFEYHDNGQWITSFANITTSPTMSYAEGADSVMVFRVRVTYGDEWYATSGLVTVKWGRPLQIVEIDGDNVSITLPEDDAEEEDAEEEDAEEEASSEEPESAVRTVFVQQPAVAKPGRVTGLTATLSGTSAALGWTAPADGGAVANYVVLRRDPATQRDLQVAATLDGTTVSWTDSGTTAGTKYIYRVQASNQAGTGTPSTPVQITVPGPLTASLRDVPEKHNGSKRFGFELRFSEHDAAITTAKVKQALSVSNGRLIDVKQVVSGKNDRMKVRARPTGVADVAITLAATTDCSATGALCTGAGRKLSNAVSATVQGPVGVTVADARAYETDPAMTFTVTLSRAAAGAATVRYATRDGTATRDDDYTFTRGTVSFAAGETSKTVSVPILDDAIDEGEETFKLKLLNSTGVVIADSEATGTIVNSDPLQQAWLARFGRAAASDALAAVTARLETPRHAGSHVTLGGYRLAGGHRPAFGGLGAVRPPAPATGADWPAWSEDPGVSRTMTARELLTGTSFRAVLGQDTGSQLTAWGRGGASVSQFSGATPGLSLSGETATGALGMDYEHGRLLTGFAMTHSLGQGTAHGAGRSYAMGSSVTTALPFARLALSERVSAWGLVGTGAGELTLGLDDGAAQRYRSDLSVTLGAAGVRGDLVTPAQGASGFALALKADAFWVRTRSDAVSAPGVGNLAGARADASRLRAMLDGSRTFLLAGDATLTPTVELGLRHDGGDAETGAGMELGAGVSYADPSRGLDMALRMHGLAGHSQDGYDEWGVSGTLRLVPGGSERGLTLSLTPSYGVDPNGSGRLWMMPDASGLAANDDAAPSSRLDTEVGYGLGAPAGLGVVTPYAALGLAGGDTRTWRAGTRWRVAPTMSFGLEGTRRESAGDRAEHGLMVGGAVSW